MHKQKLNALLFANSFFPRVDGSVLAVSHEISLLHERGHKVYLVTRKHKETSNFEIWKGVSVFRVGSDAHGLFARAKTVFEQALTGFILCRKTKIDVIHAHGAVPLAAGWLLSKVLRKPLVVTFHGFQRLWFKGTLWKSPSELKITYPVTKFLTTTADVVIAQSEKFCKVVSDLYKVDSGKMFVLPHVIDEEVFTFTSIPSFKEITVLFVGALARVYGVDLFIKAAPFVIKSFPEAKFLVVGKGPQKDRLNKLINRLKLENSVFLVGPVYDRKKLARHYQDARVVVIPQKYEGYFLSLVALEALAAGRPIVTTQTLDPELYKIGIFKASFDPKDIAEKIMKILNLDEESYSTLARTARKYFENHCSKNVIASRLEKLYLTLNQRRG